LRGDAENDAGWALGAVAPLQEAAAQDGLAVVILRHERKSGGEVGNAGRGSSAFGGAVDIVLRLRRPEGTARPGIRVIDALSRFDETAETLVVELTDGGYVAHGDQAAVATAAARTALLAAAPRSEGDAAREDELVRAAGVTRTLAQNVIAEHLAAGRLRRGGEGKKGNPYRYWCPDTGVSDSAAPREAVVAATNGPAPADADTVPATTQPIAAEPSRWRSEEPLLLSAATTVPSVAERIRTEVEASVPPSDWDGVVPLDCGKPAICKVLGPCCWRRRDGECPLTLSPAGVVA
jgi:hypothetical protein